MRFLDGNIERSPFGRGRRQGKNERTTRRGSDEGGKAPQHSTALALGAVWAATAIVTGDARAEPVTWTFEEQIGGVILPYVLIDYEFSVSGQNGVGVVSGSYVYDATTNTYSSIDVTMTLPVNVDPATGVFPVCTADPGNQLCLTIQLPLLLLSQFEGPDTFDFLNKQPNGDPGSYQISVNLKSNMTNAGGTIPVSFGIAGVCDSFVPNGPACFPDLQLDRFTGSPEVVAATGAVPEPSFLPVLIAAAVVFFGLRSRRKRLAAPLLLLLAGAGSSTFADTVPPDYIAKVFGQPFAVSQDSDGLGTFPIFTCVPDTGYCEKSTVENSYSDGQADVTVSGSSNYPTGVFSGDADAGGDVKYYFAVVGLASSAGGTVSLNPVPLEFNIIAVQDKTSRSERPLKAGRLGCGMECFRDEVSMSGSCEPVQVIRELESVVPAAGPAAGFASDHGATWSTPGK